MSINKNIVAFFSSSGIPSTGLTPIIRIWNVETKALVVEDASMSEVGDGFYVYELTSYNEENDYAIRCDGGETLGATDRYVYAGNESYLDDIWGAKTTNHTISGSFGEALVQAGGEVLSGGGGGTVRPLTEKEMEDLAKMVWEVIMDNNQKAKDVLLSRSDFDYRKDAVIIKDEVINKILSEFIPIKDAISEVLISQNKLDLIDDVIGKIGKAEYSLKSLGDKTDKLQSIAPQIKSATEGLITSIKKLTDEVAQQIKSINDGAMKRIEDSIGKNEEEIVRSLDKHREEKVEAIEKLNSSLDKMNKAINSLIDIWGKLAFNKMLNNSALRRRLRK